MRAISIVVCVCVCVCIFYESNIDTEIHLQTIIYKSNLVFCLKVSPKVEAQYDLIIKGQHALVYIIIYTVGVEFGRGNISDRY